MNNYFQSSETNTNSSYGETMNFNGGKMDKVEVYRNEIKGSEIVNAPKQYENMNAGVIMTPTYLQETVNLDENELIGTNLDDLYKIFLGDNELNLENLKDLLNELYQNLLSQFW